MQAGGLSGGLQVRLEWTALAGVGAGSASTKRSRLVGSTGQRDGSESMFVFCWIFMRNPDPSAVGEGRGGTEF